MYYSQHLDELRKRMISCVYFFVCAFAVCYCFSEKLLLLILQPARQSLRNVPLVFTHLTEGFMAHLKVSFWIALLFTFPFIIYQAWRFIAPALYGHEKNVVLRLSVYSSMVFLSGILLGYAVITPCLSIFSFWIADKWLTPMPRLHNYLIFTLKTSFFTGILLQLPLSMFLGVKSGMLQVAKCKEKRKIVYILLYIVAMSFSTGDVLTQMLLALGLISTYEAGIFFSSIAGHGKSEQ